MFLTAVDGPSGRLATYVYDSESKRRRIYEGAAFTTIVWDYLQSYAGSKPLDYHTEEGLILAQRIDEDYAEYLPDFLGTVVAFADESGSALAEARYKPYCLPLWSDGPVEDFAFGWVGQWDTGGFRICVRACFVVTSIDFCISPITGQTTSHNAYGWSGAFSFFLGVDADLMLCGDTKGL